MPLLEERCFILDLFAKSYTLGDYRIKLEKMSEGHRYEIEYAKSGRAQCRGSCKEKIEKGHLRLGSISDRDGFSATYWRHFPDCMSHKIFMNIIDSVQNAENIPGFSELKPEDRSLVIAKFRDALKGAEETTKAKSPAAKRARKGGKGKDDEITEALLEEEEKDEAEEKPKPKGKKPSKKQN